MSDNNASDGSGPRYRRKGNGEDYPPISDPIEEPLEDTLAPGAESALDETIVVRRSAKAPQPDAASVTSAPTNIPPVPPLPPMPSNPFGAQAPAQPAWEAPAAAQSADGSGGVAGSAGAAGEPVADAAPSPWGAQQEQSTWGAPPAPTGEWSQPASPAQAAWGSADAAGWNVPSADASSAPDVSQQTWGAPAAETGDAAWAQSNQPTWNVANDSNASPQWGTTDAAAAPAKEESGGLKRLLLIGVPILIVAGIVAALFLTGVLPIKGDTDNTADPGPTTSKSAEPEEPTDPLNPGAGLDVVYPLGEEADIPETPLWVIDTIDGWSTRDGAPKWQVSTDAAGTCEIATVSGNPTSGAKIPSSFDEAGALQDAIIRFLPPGAFDKPTTVDTATEPRVVQIPTTGGDGIEFIQYTLTVTDEADATRSYLVLARTWEPSDSLSFVRMSCADESILDNEELAAQMIGSLTLEVK